MVNFYSNKSTFLWAWKCASMKSKGNAAILLPYFRVFDNFS